MKSNEITTKLFTSLDQNVYDLKVIYVPLLNTSKETQRLTVKHLDISIYRCKELRSISFNFLRKRQKPLRPTLGNTTFVNYFNKILCYY